MRMWQVGEVIALKQPARFLIDKGLHGIDYETGDKFIIKSQRRDNICYLWDIQGREIVLFTSTIMWLFDLAPETP